MELVQKLANFATQLDEESLSSFAGRVDAVMQSFVRTAQYLGSQGYWVRNSRCWGNCYRQKRASNPNMPAQKVWTECQEEYQASINNDGSTWDKYAGSDTIIRTAHTKELDSQFAQLAINLDSYEAPQAIIAAAVDSYYKELTAGADEMLAISEVIEPYDAQLAKTANDIADQMLGDALSISRLTDYNGVLAERAGEMLKEAQFNATRALWNNTLGNKGVGGWLGNKFKNIRDDYKANKTKQYQDWLAKNGPQAQPQPQQPQPPQQPVGGGLEGGGNTTVVPNTTGKPIRQGKPGGLQNGGATVQNNGAAQPPKPAVTPQPDSTFSQPNGDVSGQFPQTSQNGPNGYKPYTAPEPIDLSPESLRKMDDKTIGDNIAKLNQQIATLNKEKARRGNIQNSGIQPGATPGSQVYNPGGVGNFSSFSSNKAKTLFRLS